MTTPAGVPTTIPPPPPHCPHCKAAMTEGVGFYSWTLGPVTILCIHCIAPGCRAALYFQVAPTPGVASEAIVKGFA
jgi:hypothetical protein